MLGKRTRPAIRRLTGSSRPSTAVDTVTTSPKSPLPQPQRGIKTYDQGLVGLGIVLVALDKSETAYAGGGEILVKYALASQSNGRSDPIPVNPANNFDKFRGCYEESLENYTYVTRRKPDESVTRVYYDGGEYSKVSFRGGGGFKVTSIGGGGEDDSYGCPCPSDFLSSCHLCRKTLHGKDIYMYRGEKAFCSAECRQRQIATDERKEQCRSEASRSSVDVSSSPCSSSSTSERGRIFSTGIVAI